MKAALSCFLIMILAGHDLSAGQEKDAPVASSEWKVGLAEVKITPEQPVLLSGYAGRNKPFEKVAADLYVKAMVLEDKNGQRAALVTSDLLGFPAAVAEPICEIIEKKDRTKARTHSAQFFPHARGPTAQFENPGHRCCQ